MNFIKKNINNLILLVLILFITNNFVLAGTLKSNTNDDKNLYWKPKLEYAFLKTFSSSHEFSACQVFQKLGYDLAEISEIKKITPFPASLTIEFEGLRENNLNIIASNSSTDNALKILEFDKLNVICNKVHYFNMVIDKVIFGFPKSAIDFDYLDKGRLKFIYASKIELNIKVSENDILEVLKLYPKSKLLSNVKVKLSPNSCLSTGRVRLGILTADFRLNGHIKILSSKTVDFVCDKLKINGITQPRAFVKSIMNYINPAFDSSKVWINLNVNSMNIIDGYIVTEAAIDKKGN